MQLFQKEGTICGRNSTRKQRNNYNYYVLKGSELGGEIEEGYGGKWNQLR